MFLDGGLTFNSAVGTAQAITATADSAGIIDVTGAGSGNSPAMINGPGAANTALGSDYGLGDSVATPHVFVTITAVGTSTNTLTIAVKAAPDNGSYGQGTYTTLVQTPAIVENTLAVGDIIDIPLPPTRYTEAEALPRFYKLTYTASAALTTSVLANLVLNPESATAGGVLYNNNFIAV